MTTNNKKSILIDSDLHYNLKVYCAQNGLFMHEVLEKLIKTKLDKSL